MYEINIRSGVPMYDQLLKMIMSRIVEGILKPDDPLPSIRTLAKEVGINPNTVAKSYRELEREKLIYSVPGSGVFVADINEKKMEEYLLQEFDAQVIQALNIGFTKEILIKRIENIKRK